MKLNKKYFEEKFDELLVEITKWELGKSCGKHVVKILHQIARDGADAQRVADDTSVLQELTYSRNNNETKLIDGLTLARYAIESATVDVPGE